MRFSADFSRIYREPRQGGQPTLAAALLGLILCWAALVTDVPAVIRLGCGPYVYPGLVVLTE